VRARDYVTTAVLRYPLVSNPFFSDSANDSDLRKISTEPRTPAIDGLPVTIATNHRIGVNTNRYDLINCPLNRTGTM
jgi:hypothetical protein